MASCWNTNSVVQRLARRLADTIQVRTSYQSLEEARDDILSDLQERHQRALLLNGPEELPTESQYRFAAGEIALILRERGRFELLPAQQSSVDRGAVNEGTASTSFPYNDFQRLSLQEQPAPWSFANVPERPLHLDNQAYAPPEGFNNSSPPTPPSPVDIPVNTGHMISDLAIGGNLTTPIYLHDHRGVMSNNVPVPASHAIHASQNSFTNKDITPPAYIYGGIVPNDVPVPRSSEGPFERFLTERSNKNETINEGRGSHINGNIQVSSHVGQRSPLNESSGRVSAPLVVQRVRSTRITSSSTSTLIRRSILSFGGSSCNEPHNTSGRPANTIVNSWGTLPLLQTSLMRVCPNPAVVSPTELINAKMYIDVVAKPLRNGRHALTLLVKGREVRLGEVDTSNISIQTSLFYDDSEQQRQEPRRPVLRRQEPQVARRNGARYDYVMSPSPLRG